MRRVSERVVALKEAVHVLFRHLVALRVDHADRVPLGLIAPVERDVFGAVARKERVQRAHGRDGERAAALNGAAALLRAHPAPEELVGEARIAGGPGLAVLQRLLAALGRFKCAVERDGRARLVHCLNDLVEYGAFHLLPARVRHATSELGIAVELLPVLHAEDGVVDVAEAAKVEGAGGVSEFHSWRGFEKGQGEAIG